MATSRRWLTTATAAISLVLLGACDSAEQTPPPSRSPAPSSTKQSSTFTPAPGVPRVQNPLDGAAFEKDPCTSLTPQQLETLKLDTGNLGSGDNPEQSEDNCTYADLDPATGLLVYVNYYPENKAGLSDRYEQHRGGYWPKWKPGAVDGYPAVFFHYNPDDPTDCNVDVGISDTTVFNVKFFYYGWKGYNGQDTCARAKSIASTVLSNIKAAN